MLPDRVSNPGPLAYESGALPIALRGPDPALGAGTKGLAILQARMPFLYYRNNLKYWDR